MQCLRFPGETAEAADKAIIKCRAIAESSSQSLYKKCAEKCSTEAFMADSE
jgi:hypothetical protein